MLHDSQIACMKLHGFVHVTGLPVKCIAPYIIQAHEWSLGKWGKLNGVIAIVTEEGEVWIGHGYGYDPRFTKMLCPNGSGAFVPCCDGDRIDMNLLLERMRNPYSDCGGRYSPHPVIKREREESIARHPI